MFAEMYIFGIVVSENDCTPTGRASAAVRAQLPALFPEHDFQFYQPKELRKLAPELGPQEVNKFLFRVVGTTIPNTDEIVDERAAREMIETIQAVVDRTVAAAKISNAC